MPNFVQSKKHAIGLFCEITAKEYHLSACPIVNLILFRELFSLEWTTPVALSSNIVCNSSELTRDPQMMHHHFYNHEIFNFGNCYFKPLQRFQWVDQKSYKNPYQKILL